MKTHDEQQSFVQQHRATRALYEAALGEHASRLSLPFGETVQLQTRAQAQDAARVQTQALAGVVLVHRSQFLGQTIRHLRRMALAGAAPDELEAFLKMRSGDNTWAPVHTLGRVFLQSNLFMYLKTNNREATNVFWSRLIEARREDWQREPVPELMRLRDYFSFMQFCQQEQVVAVVVAANPAAGQWIGAPGVACYDGSVPVLSRIAPPHDGLLAADPNDPRLAELLAGFAPPLTYAAYVAKLAELGLRVTSADGGYLVVDRADRRLHEAYRLLGVYDAKTHAPAWTPANAERLRATLNRHLGRELVRSGPHDAWEYRNDPRVAGPLVGPLTPALAFNPRQNINPILKPYDLALLSPYKIRWADLFPNHPIVEES